jgi:hypothetical protein
MGALDTNYVNERIRLMFYRNILLTFLHLFTVDVMQERGVACRVLVGKPEKERSHLEDLGIDGKIILKEIFSRKYKQMHYTTI